MPDKGLIPGSEVDAASLATMLAFIGIGFANGLELNVRIFTFFRRYSGLYFWSLLIACWGAILHCIGDIVKFFNIAPRAPVILIGWILMVTGQSVVMWSRLSLVMSDKKKLRWVLAMIIVDGVVLHGLVTIIGPMSASSLPYAMKMADVYSYLEKVQMTIFSVQEFIISMIYIVQTRKLMKQQSHAFTGGSSVAARVMSQLIWINAFIILMDIALLSVEYANLYDIESAMKPAVYAYKLRLEFVILNQLMRVIRGEDGSGYKHNKNSGSTVGPDAAYSAYVKSGGSQVVAPVRDSKIHATTQVSVRRTQSAIKSSTESIDEKGSDSGSSQPQEQWDGGHAV